MDVYFLAPMVITGGTLSMLEAAADCTHKQTDKNTARVRSACERRVDAENTRWRCARQRHGVGWQFGERSCSKQQIRAWEFGCTTVAADTEGLSVAVAIIEPAFRATLSMSATSISEELAARIVLYALAKDSFSDSVNVARSPGKVLVMTSPASTNKWL